ncbi:MAG TPA: transposase family protein [Verrucomicrobiae bacterium]|nr:transposase family protein [Verrucomicrobiae bacterium]
MVNSKGYIVHKVGYKKGRKHDYDVYKNNHSVVPKEFVTLVDLGYLGVETDFPEQLSGLPYKKKRNQELSQEEKEYNTIHAKKRIIVEHTISRFKKYRILNDIFRNKLRKYNKV